MKHVSMETPSDIIHSAHGGSEDDGNLLVLLENVFSIICDKQFVDGCYGAQWALTSRFRQNGDGHFEDRGCLTVNYGTFFIMLPVKQSICIHLLLF